MLWSFPLWVRSLCSFYLLQFHHPLPHAITPKVVCINMNKNMNHEKQWLNVVSRYKSDFRAEGKSIVEIDATGTQEGKQWNHLSFPSLYAASLLQSRSVMPLFHSYSSFHYQQVYGTRFGKTLSYPQYCQLEEAFSRVVQAYLHDTSLRVFFIYVSDPLWFSEESLPSFLIKEEMEKMIRVCVRDLDRDAKDVICPVSSHVSVFLWDHHVHDWI